MVSRVIRHFLAHPWQLKRAFPRPTLDAIEAAIKFSELRHGGELRFAIETAWPLIHVVTGRTSRKRAIEVFNELGMPNTKQGGGVLIYVLLAEHRLEIVADHGISRKVGQQEWDAIAGQMQVAYRKGEFRQGSLDGIEAVTRLLERHFPPGETNPNELPDKPVIIRR
jgi:uncharacterized membrane protein